MSRIKAVLVGNPNCGKTTLFNLLTGLNQRVGNWPGVTVERKTGVIQRKAGTIKLIDLPGIYALQADDASAIDERIAADYLAQEDIDVIINVLDASQLSRSLYLTTQLMDLGVPVVAALNMMDTAERGGLSIDTAVLSDALGLPVFPLVSKTGSGVTPLVEAVFQHSQVPKPVPAARAEVDADQQAVADVDVELLVAQSRYEWIEGVLAQAMGQHQTPRQSLTAWVDRVVLNRILGIPIFLLIMYTMFEFSITIGGALQPLFDVGSQVIFIEGVAHLGHQLHLPETVTVLLASGLGLGINTVVTFIPQIGAMFLFLTFLEGSGYMARAAFVIDRLMQWVGLPGKSFVPLIVGFGCNVPSIMAARTLESHRDRLITIMMAPFMSCGARLAIFAVFSSAFFPEGGALVVFGLYLTGIGIALLTGMILKKTLLQGAPSPFMMALPTYHLPRWRTLFGDAAVRLKHFVLRAGRVILPVCLVLGGLNNLHFSDESGHPQDSVLAVVGQRITPIFHPMGITQENWPASVGLFTGTVAKEVVIGTLNTLYSQQHVAQIVPDEDFSLSAGLLGAWQETVDRIRGLAWSDFSNPFRANVVDDKLDATAMGRMIQAFGSTISAFAYMLFVLLYIPCVSTIAAASKEAGRFWSVLSSIWSVSIAYALSVVVYQGYYFTVQPLVSGAWIAGMVAYIGLFIYGLHVYAERAGFSHRYLPPAGSMKSGDCADCYGRQCAS